MCSEHPRTCPTLNKEMAVPSTVSSPVPLQSKSVEASQFAGICGSYVTTTRYVRNTVGQKRWKVVERTFLPISARLDEWCTKPSPSPFRLPSQSIEDFVECNSAKPAYGRAFCSMALNYRPGKHQPTTGANILSVLMYTYLLQWKWSCEIFIRHWSSFCADEDKKRNFSGNSSFLPNWNEHFTPIVGPR